MRLIFTSIFAILISFQISAAEITIEMLNKDSNGNKQVYSNELVHINVGDTVKWIPTSKGHNVEMIASPNNMKLKSRNNKEVSVTFDTSGIYYYLCTPHKAMGMIGLVIVGGDTSNKEQIEKAKALGKSKKKLKLLLGKL
jgi:pseudoazurin